MLNFERLLKLKIIVLAVAVALFAESTVYGIDLPTKHLRVPMLGAVERIKEIEGRNRNKILNTQKLFSFLAQRDELPEKADLIMVLGSDDIAVPIEAARLYNQGLAPKIIVAGGIGRLTKGLLEKFKEFLNEKGESEEKWIREEEYEIDSKYGRVIPEARIFQKILMVLGVAEEDILVEDKSTNTGENIQFSRKVLDENNIQPKTVIVMQTPLLQIRAGASFEKQFGLPDVKCISYAPYLPYANEMDSEELDSNIELALGEMERIRQYSPPQGDFLGKLDIPQGVEKAELEARRDSI